LPDAAKNIARSMHIFKAEVKGLRDDDAAQGHSQPTQAQAQIPQPLPPAPLATPTAGPAAQPQGDQQAPVEVPRDAR
jgi:sec-independent protein translocase protein TatA